MVKVSVVVIGGGVVGSLIALELKRRWPFLDIVITEQEPYLGHHTSSRNSGVIHSGLYYKTGSFKHLFSLYGNREWEKLSQKLEVPFRRVGKFIVASTREESLKLDGELRRRSKRNGVCFREATSKERRTLNHYTNALKALFFQTTAILDTSTLLKNLENSLMRAEIPVLFENEVMEIKRRGDKGEGFFITSTREEIETDIVINAGGLFAPKIREKVTKAMEQTLLHSELSQAVIAPYFLKGNYLKLKNGVPFYKEHLIYPVPPEKEVILGVHSTFDFSLALKFGPDGEKVDEISYAMSEKVKEQMVENITARFPHIKKDSLQLDFCGIRPKIMMNGMLYNDFWIEKYGNYIDLQGIDSPGLTASPIIAQYVGLLLEKSIKEAS